MSQSFNISLKSILICFLFSSFSSFSFFFISTCISKNKFSLSLLLSIALNLSSLLHSLLNSDQLVLLVTPASSQRVLKASFLALALAFFSFLSSSALSLTYLSNTDFLSLLVNNRYRGSNTILCNSFSHVENAEMCFSSKRSLNCCIRVSRGTTALSRLALTSASIAASLPAGNFFLVSSLIIITSSLPMIITLGSSWTFIFLGAGCSSSTGNAFICCFFLNSSADSGLSSILATSLLPTISAGFSHTDCLLVGL